MSLQVSTPYQKHRPSVGANLYRSSSSLSHTGGSVADSSTARTVSASSPPASQYEWQLRQRQALGFGFGDLSKAARTFPGSASASQQQLKLKELLYNQIESPGGSSTARSGGGDAYRYVRPAAMVPLSHKFPSAEYVSASSASKTNRRQQLYLQQGGGRAAAATRRLLQLRNQQRLLRQNLVLKRHLLRRRQQQQLAVKQYV